MPSITVPLIDSGASAVAGSTTEGLADAKSIFIVTSNFDDSEIPCGTSAAEQLAVSCLKKGRCSTDDLLELSSLLPSEAQPRSAQVCSDERSFTTGAYCHGPMSGLRNAVKTFLAVSCLMASLAKSVFPKLTFSSLGLFRNIKTRRHKDLRNLAGSLNGVAPLCKFKGGGIRVHNDAGFSDLPVAEGPVFFDASKEHETLEWSGGPRLVLVAFSVARLSGLSSTDIDLLHHLGFLLPDLSFVNFPKGHPEVAASTTSAIHGAPTGIVLDVFAGDAGLCKAAQKSGYQAIAFDINPQRAQFPIQPLNPTKVDEMQILLDLVSEHAASLLVVQCTVPLLGAFFSQDRGSPAFATALASAVRNLVDHCVSLGVPVAILHPASSTFWEHTAVTKLWSLPGGHWTTFDQCMHGGAQDRRAHWWCTTSLFGALSALCAKDHKHFSQPSSASPWPSLLWLRAVELLNQACSKPTVNASLFGPPGATLRPAMGKQSRKARPLVSEFRAYDAWAVPLRSDPADLLSCYPKGARVVRRKLCVWGQVGVCSVPSVDFKVLESRLSAHWMWASDPDHFSTSDDKESTTGICGSCLKTSHDFEDNVEVVWVGIPREPDDFLAKAVLAGHPKALLDSEPDPHMLMLIDNLLEGSVDSPQKGRAELDRWKTLKANFSEQQDSVRKDWDPHVREVLGDKSTVLLDFLLKEIDFPDHRLVKHMTQGFRLSGWVCRTGLFPFDPKPPSSTIASQLKTAKARNVATLSAISKQADDEISEKAWAETIEESRKGWIFEDEAPELDKILIAHRFGLRQGPKIRVIDNCKSCSFNLTTGVPEKYRLHGVEFIAAFLLLAMRDPRSRGCKIRGRTLDLTAAYKQYAVHRSDRDVLRIGVKDAEQGRARIFGTNSLPFGATGSVPSFLRCAAAIWLLGAKSLGIAWTSYFDDNPMFAKAESSDTTDSLAADFLDLFSILFAREGKKATSFDQTFRALGLLFDLSRFDEGEVTIGHTKERGEELKATISAILAADCLSHAEAESLRGRLHWYTSFLFGRRSSQALNVVSDWVNRGVSSGRLSEDLKDALKYLKDVALDAPPLKISRTLHKTFLIFTDGSLEGNTACVGGILHDGEGKAIAFFSIELDSLAVARLHEHSEHPIYEIELLGIWAALSIWQECIHDSFCVCYLDNEAARGALVAARSSTLKGSLILEDCLRLEDSALCRPWFGRVPTHSNCAGDPSRGSFDHLLAKGTRRDYLSSSWPF